MNQARLNRAERSELTALRAAQAAEQRCATFYQARKHVEPIPYGCNAARVLYGLQPLVK